MITYDRIVTSDGKYPDRSVSPELTLDVRLNIGELARLTTACLTEAGFDTKALVINSGFRTVAANKAAGGSKFSSHCSGMAIDIADPDGLIYRTLSTNIPLLQKYGLYLEDGSKTVGWCHVTSRRPPSGKQIFLP